VFLDSIGFSGFNTAMQAVECDLPIVTLEGDSLRGRFGAGILREMGLGEYVASDVHAYADIAARLAHDAGERERVRARMRDARAKVFATEAPVREFESFLLRNHAY
jgi:protein O-GlcNAc transferase